MAEVETRQTPLNAAERNLLVPVDDAEEGERALTWAIENVYREGDAFHFLHVLPPAEHFSASTEMQPVNLQKLQAQGFVQDRFFPLVDRLGAKRELTIVEADAGNRDSAGEQICIKAEEVHAALVVMSAHHKGRMLQYLIGSTTQYCINKCHTTVLVYH